MRYSHPGAALVFGLALIGPVARLFPYLVMAAQAIKQSGLGRRLGENGGRRGALQLAAIAAVNPLSGARQPLDQRDHAQGQPDPCREERRQGRWLVYDRRLINRTARAPTRRRPC